MQNAQAAPPPPPRGGDMVDLRRLSNAMGREPRNRLNGMTPAKTQEPHHA